MNVKISVNYPKRNGRKISTLAHSDARLKGLTVYLQLNKYVKVINTLEYLKFQNQSSLLAARDRVTELGQISWTFCFSGLNLYAPPKENLERYS